MREFIDRWARHRGVLVVVLMSTYSVQSLVITASKRGGGFAYDATAAVFFAEVLKLVFALAMLTPEARAKLDPWQSPAYAIPAVLYTLQNRLVFEALRRLSPPEYQLLNNMKLLTTSVLYRVIMRRQLRLLQWLALLLLVLGMTLATQPPEDGHSSGKADGANGEDAAAPLSAWGGVSIMVVVSWCSAFAGVLNEWLIKRSSNVLEANVWLYTYGAAACMLNLGPSGCLGLLSLEGFSAVTWAVVLCNAVLGQSIAFLFRYADSIVKLHAVCAAMGFTTLVSVALLGFELRFHMVAGYVASAISLCLYYAPPELLNTTDAELCTRGRSKAE